MEPKDRLNGVDHADTANALPAPGLDPDLEFEERYSKVVAENGDLKRENADLQYQLKNTDDRFDRLQQSTVRESYLTLLNL